MKGVTARVLGTAVLVVLTTIVLDRVRSARADDVKDARFAVLRVSEVQVLAADGTVLLRLGSSPEGGGGMVFSKDGKPGLVWSASGIGGQIAVQAADGGRCAFLGVADTSSAGVLHLNRKDGERLVEAGSGTSGGYVSVRNAEGKAAALVGTAEGGGGTVQVHDRHGVPAADLTSENVGPQLRLLTELGGIAALLGVSPESDGPVLSLSGKEGKPVATLGQVEFGGALTLSSMGGKVMVQASAERPGGLIVVNRAGENVAAQVLATTDGGQLMVANKEGNRIVELSGGAEGGQIDVRRRDGKDGVKVVITTSGPGVIVVDATGKRTPLK